MAINFTYLLLYSHRKITSIQVLEIKNISLELLGNYIHELTTHSATSGHPVEFLDESRKIGLCSVLTARSSSCLKTLKAHASKFFNEKGHYSCNITAMLRQVTTGGEGAHLEKQLMCLDIPSILCPFTHLYILVLALHWKV